MSFPENFSVFNSYQYENKSALAADLDLGSFIARKIFGGKRICLIKEGEKEDNRLLLIVGGVALLALTYYSMLIGVGLVAGSFFLLGLKVLHLKHSKEGKAFIEDFKINNGPKISENLQKIDDITSRKIVNSESKPKNSRDETVEIDDPKPTPESSTNEPVLKPLIQGEFNEPPEQGLNLIGKCASDCFKRKLITLKKGIGKFNLAKEVARANCSQCNKKLNDVKVFLLPPCNYVYEAGADSGTSVKKEAALVSDFVELDIGGTFASVDVQDLK